MLLVTEHLRLVPFAFLHLGDLHRLWTDPQVRRFLWDDQIISEQEATEVIEVSLQTFEQHGFVPRPWTEAAMEFARPARLRW